MASIAKTENAVSWLDFASLNHIPDPEVLSQEYWRWGEWCCIICIQIALWLYSKHNITDLCPVFAWNSTWGSRCHFVVIASSICSPWRKNTYVQLILLASSIYNSILSDNLRWFLVAKYAEKSGSV